MLPFTNFLIVCYSFQVYQASTTTRTAPGGVREVQRSVSDSRSGVRKMAVGRHLGERGHVVEKEQNYYTGDSEEREDFINIEEGEFKNMIRMLLYIEILQNHVMS